jgi:predicted DNA-binding transcriptional regulator YafY
MPDPAARLLALLSLLQTPREGPSSELAQRLRVTDGTVRRDVERLRGLGYPVEASMGVYGGYRLAAGAGISWPSTSTARTGGPSGPTASSNLTPPVAAAHRELPGGGVHIYLAEARADMAPVVRGDVILDLSFTDAESRLRDSLGDGRIEAWAHGRTRWRTHADTVPWLASQILHLGCEFEVCGPPELSRYLRELADRIVRAVSK